MTRPRRDPEGSKPLPRSWATVGLVVALLFTPVSFGYPLAQGTFLERYREWSLYAFDDPTGKVCFMVSVPTAQEGNFSRRGQPRLFVTQFGGERPRQEVSVDPGYTFRKGSVVVAVVDGVRFELFTEQDRAWTSSAEADARLIDAMRRGRQIQLRGTSTRETWSLDTYSLAGFTAALKAMTDACRRGQAR